MKKVTVYTLPACVQCDSTKRYLDKKGVIYDTVDLSKSKKAMKYVTELGYTQAPVVETETKHWSGFRMGELDNLVRMIHTEAAKP
jgi:glutaredoxin-like protein NrdH